MDTPEWVLTWTSCPSSKNDWAWTHREELYRFALLLLSFGPIIIGGGFRGKGGRKAGPRDVMENTAKTHTLHQWYRWRKQLADSPRPLELPVYEKPPKKTWEPFKPAPAYRPELVSGPITEWAELAVACYPEHPEGIRLAQQLLLIQAKAALGLEPKAPWSSYWVCSRALFREAAKEWEMLIIPPDMRRTLGQLPTIWHRLLDARALGYTVATEDAGADSGAAQDEDFLPDGTTRPTGGGSPGGSALSEPDDGLPEGLGVLDLDGDLKPLDADED